MKNDKPKGRTPSLIGSTLGRPQRVLVEGKSKCKRCKGEIPAGTNCIAIPQLGGPFSNKARYCEGCYKKILEQTRIDLDEVSAL